MLTTTEPWELDMCLLYIYIYRPHKLHAKKFCLKHFCLENYKRADDEKFEVMTDKFKEM
jgi:hypothetical protein